MLKSEGDIVYYIESNTLRQRQNCFSIIPGTKCSRWSILFAFSPDGVGGLCRSTTPKEYMAPPMGH